MLALKLRDAPTNAEIRRLSEENPGYRFERAADGTLVVSPTGSAGGARNAKLTVLMGAWNNALPTPGVCFDSSTGFTLPDGSLISPDGAWITPERWGALSQDEREGYAPLVPDVVIEIASKTDRFSALREKLQGCRAVGARYVLALDPFRQQRWEDGDPPEGLRITIDEIL